MFRIMEVYKIQTTKLMWTESKLSQVFGVIALILLVSACVTTGNGGSAVKNQQVRNVAKHNCSANVITDGQNGQTAQAPSKKSVQNNCLPKGKQEVQV